MGDIDETPAAEAGPDETAADGHAQNMDERKELQAMTEPASMYQSHSKTVDDICEASGSTLPVSSAEVPQSASAGAVTEIGEPLEAVADRIGHPADVIASFQIASGERPRDVPMELADSDAAERAKHRKSKPIHDCWPQKVEHLSPHLQSGEDVLSDELSAVLELVSPSDQIRPDCIEGANSPMTLSALGVSKIDTSSASAFVKSLSSLDNESSPHLSGSKKGTSGDICVEVDRSATVDFENTDAFLASLGLSDLLLESNHASPVTNPPPDLSKMDYSPALKRNRCSDGDTPITSAKKTDDFSSVAATKEPHKEADITMIRSTDRDLPTPMEIDAVAEPRKQESPSARKFEKTDHGTFAKPVLPSSSRLPTSEKLAQLLESYGLKKFYPGRLSSERVREQTSCAPEKKDRQTAPLWFFYKLMHNHVDARSELVTNGVAEPHFNSIDVLHTLLFVADDVLRREIIAKMAMLQYALPVCVKLANQREPLILNWSLRSVVKRWKAEIGDFTEDDMHVGRFVYVFFIRIGKIPVSKSKILNRLFPRENAPFQNTEEDDVPRSLSDGTVEVSWLLPSQNETWSPLVIANLRGDATEHLDLLKWAMPNSKHIFVFVGSDIQESDQVLSRLKQVKQKVVLIVPKGCNSGAVKEFQTIQESEAKIVTNLKQIVLSNNDREKVSFEKWEKEGKRLGFALEDEKEFIRKGKQMAEAVLKDYDPKSKAPLPIQSQKWTEYSQLHKEQHRLKKKPEKMPISDYCSQVLKQQKELRAAQSKTILPQHFATFAQCLCSRPAERKFFLLWLEYFLDKRSRAGIGNITPGLEHYMRELFQVYEVHQMVVSSGIGTPRTSLIHILQAHSGQTDPAVCLRNTVVEMMLEGNPVELLDGDAQGIPEVWMRDLMLTLSNRLGKNSTIGVISVLGVQSSGKSTLLNAMFGCKFTVSTGRCTRGVNMQLLKVNKQFANICGTDYLLILDSEGLKSPEKQDLAGSTEHDSELGTLVVGLSDVVIINVASESMDALKDIIQITIHAFIRMKQTNRQKTKCFFVHQNTGDPSACKKLANERMLFERTLQELTDIAVKMEFPEGARKLDFRQILDYGRENSHEYFPGLYSGTPPMAPVNSGYAAKVMSVKEMVLRSLNDGMKLTADKFASRVTEIWQAVLKEDFIFSFKNSLIASKRTDLDEKIAAWEWDLRTELKEFLEGLQTEILNETKIPDFTKYSRKVQAIHQEKMLQMTQSVTDYLKQDPIANQYFLEEAKASVKTFVTRAEDEMTQGIKNFLKVEEARRSVDVMQVEIEQLMQTKITSLVEEFLRKGDELTREEADEAFEALWTDELRKLDNSQLQDLRDLGIDGEIQYVLFDFVPPTEHRYLKEMLREGINLSGYAGTEVELFEGDLSCVHSSFSNMKNKAMSYLTFSNTHPGALLAQHRDPVTAFIASVLKNFETKILGWTRNPKLTPADVPDLTRKIFKQVDEAKYPGRKVILTKPLRLRIMVRVAGFLAVALESFRTYYLEQNDPLLKLGRQKEQFRQIFLDLCASRSLSFATAGKFMSDCLLPGILESVRISMDRILASQFKDDNDDLRNRKTCEISLFRHLQSQGNFFLYLDVIHQYKTTIQIWLRRRMDGYYGRSCPCDICSSLGRTVFDHLLFERMESSILLVRNLLLNIVRQAANSDISFRDVLKAISANTITKLVLRMDNLESFAGSTDGLEFAEHVLKIIDDPTSWSVASSFRKVYSELADRALEFLVESLIGCGNSCPFCGAPCAMNSSQHAEHTAEFHRPQIIGGYSFEGSDDAMVETCPAYISGGSGKNFKNQETRFQFVPFRDYKTVYPTWNIPPDSTVESSMFWKWVIVSRASEFALYYGFNEESLPATWRAITWDMVNQELAQMEQRDVNDDDGEVVE